MVWAYDRPMSEANGRTRALAGRFFSALLGLRTTELLDICNRMLDVSNLLADLDAATWLGGDLA